MNRHRLLGLSLVLIAAIFVLVVPTYAEHPWTEEAPMYGRDTDTSGGKQGAEDVFNRWTRQDLFKSGNMFDVITANINLLIIDWYAEHELVKAAPADDTNVLVSRSTEAVR